MALLSAFVSHKHAVLPSHSFPSPNSHGFPIFPLPLILRNKPRKCTIPYSYIASSRYLENHGDEEEEDGQADCSFDRAVLLFNDMEYYGCHDILESLWYNAEDSTRTLIHGVLQCAVGLHHLFNRNHRGAMMVLGEGLCKLRKMNFVRGPFHQFEQEISAILNFVYQTQIELAACTEDVCVTMDQSDRSYQLLEGYAAGQQVYRLARDPDDTMYVVFCPQTHYAYDGTQRVKLPILNASQQHLLELDR